MYWFYFNAGTQVPTPSLINRCPDGPRSHRYGSWFPLEHVNAPSGSSPTSCWCQNISAKWADVAPGRKSSDGRERKGLQRERKPPNSTASDWTAASPVWKEWSWLPRQSQRGREVLHRGTRDRSRRLNPTTRDDPKKRGRKRTSRRCFLTPCRIELNASRDTGTRSLSRSEERRKKDNCSDKGFASGLVWRCWNNLYQSINECLFI